MHHLQDAGVSMRTEICCGDYGWILGALRLGSIRARLGIIRYSFVELGVDDERGRIT